MKLQQIANAVSTGLGLISVLLFLQLSGCGSSPSAAPENINFDIPAKELIKKGMEEFNMGKYFMAIEYFNKVLDSHRFSPQAPLAELRVADCSYYMLKYSEAYVFYEKFEEMHPTNEAIPYVKYQKAMCYYKKLDRVDRNISVAHTAIEKFQQLLNNYPDSQYSADAKAKINSCKEFLAHHEFAVAKFYLRTDKDSQAASRLKYLINMYPKTQIVPQAKELLANIKVEEKVEEAKL